MRLQNLHTLYEKDFCSWVNQNVDLLKHKEFAKLDIKNLIEELEGMARKEKRELSSRLVELLCHLLKWDYQEAYRGASWVHTIMEQQRQIKMLLKDSPSLNYKIEDLFVDAYQEARTQALAETNLAKKTFPMDCPYDLDVVLSRKVIFKS